MQNLLESSAAPHAPSSISGPRRGSLPAGSYAAERKGAHAGLGDPIEAINSSQHDRVHVADSAEEIQRLAIADWWKARESGSDVLLIAGTRAQTSALNLAARERLAGEHRLTGPTIEVGSRDLQVGNEVLLLQNDGNHWDIDQGSKCRVDNGSLGRVLAVDTTTRSIEIEERNGRRVRIGAEYLDEGNVTHGYATTIHKAQGTTVDDVFVVGVAGLYREAGYVALSRA